MKLNATNSSDIKEKKGNKSVTGPYFEKENFCLINGDCIPVMKSIPEESFDMIYADPPYMLSNNGITCKSGKMVSVNKGKWDFSKGLEEDYKFHEAWITECKRVLKPNGTIWISGTYHSIYQCGFLLQNQGYHILNDITWFKPNASPNMGCRCFTASHETLLWAKKNKEAKHYFNYDAMKTGDFPKDKLKNPGTQMRSVWSIPPPAKTEKECGNHPTQKPLDLMSRIIVASTKAGDIILDPFCGSGTTGIAALIIGERNFIGIDTDSSYLELAKNRFNQINKV